MLYNLFFKNSSWWYSPLFFVILLFLSYFIGSFLYFHLFFIYLFHLHLIIIYYFVILIKRDDFSISNFFCGFCPVFLSHVLLLSFYVCLFFFYFYKLTLSRYFGLGFFDLRLLFRRIVQFGLLLRSCNFLNGFLLCLLWLSLQSFRGC